MLFPPDVVQEIDVGVVDKEITFDEFNRLLLKGEVTDDWRQYGKGHLLLLLVAFANPYLWFSHL